MHLREGLTLQDPFTKENMTMDAQSFYNKDFKMVLLHIYTWKT